LFFEEDAPVGGIRIHVCLPGWRQHHQLVLIQNPLGNRVVVDFFQIHVAHQHDSSHHPTGVCMSDQFTVGPVEHHRARRTDENTRVHFSPKKGGTAAARRTRKTPVHRRSMTVAEDPQYSSIVINKTFFFFTSWTVDPIGS
jgi:hypothetical protein